MMRLFAVLLALSLSTVLAGEPARYGLGHTPQSGEISRWDIDVMPDGRGLPPGSGTPARGAEIFAGRCQACHGPDGVGGPNGSLVGEFDPQVNYASDRTVIRTVGNYWPYATTLYDYINRAMPFDAPGSLDAGEVYSLAAYLLYRNGIIAADVVMDADTLPAVRMPASVLFYRSEEAGP